ncbi:MAG: helix-turn-helix domain-containing protein [Parashewanella sp.]
MSDGQANFFSLLGFVSGNALPGIFWLTSLTVFGEQDDLKFKHYAIGSSTLVFPIIVNSLVAGLAAGPTESALVSVSGYGQLLLELALILHALYISLSNWRNDLVQERRYIRGAVISATAVYIASIIIFEQVLQLQGNGLELFKGTLLAILVFVVNLLLIEVKINVLFADKSPAVEKQTLVKKTPNKELQRIIHSMEAEKLYQQDGMTISTLSKHVAVHEYKLRHLINGELNFRNFNDFLNHYRIKEVSEKLTLPELAQTPILTLALESGFRSLSSFNKAFKTTHGMTPTEFRKQN